MSHLETYQVYPDIPESIRFVEELSRNLWWCWQRDAIDLFRRVDPKLWDKSERNPIVFSTYVGQKRLEELSKDQSILAHLKRISENYEKYILPTINWDNTPYGKNGNIAYFSMEFGIHETLPIFAGGLGILAGDHLKESSDMAMPLCAIGLLYRFGYFRQFLDKTGWQQEDYPETDLYHLPLAIAKDVKGDDLYISIKGPDGTMHALVWQIMVGRIPLLLLDTNIPMNPPHVRDFTSRLYISDAKMRIAQEILLGIGGLKALEGMGIFPSVIHLNEGHCSFSVIERLAQTMKKYNVDLRTAMEIVPRSTVFTTHTPVPAGHDEFPVDLVKPYLVPYQEILNTSIDEMISWGQAKGASPHEPFSMFIVGKRFAQYCNGVSELHGKVARKMWAHVWPGRPVEEIPISYVTNGIHIPTWLSHENSVLFDRYLGPDWHLKTHDDDIVKRIDGIYSEELWRAHEMNRSRLIRTCRKLMLMQYERRNAPKEMLKDAETVLDQGVLTIAFARRFATYKRANLILHDLKRIEAIITNEERPVQFIFAGKAHPKDHEGKELIKRLIEFARKPNIRKRFVFLENYDIHLARHLVHGADIWLNNPRRPYEACGTSGMKAAMNGVLNVSILDGWWCEGYAPELGWEIKHVEDFADPAYQDDVESEALFNVLENEVVPCFYERKSGDIPDRWVEMMKASMKMVMSRFSSNRMLREYREKYYLPCIAQLNELVENNAEKAKKHSLQYKRLHELWKGIQLEIPASTSKGPYRVGDSFTVNVIVHLGGLKPEEVDVEFFKGKVRSVEYLEKTMLYQMQPVENRGNGVYLYSTDVSCEASGRFGFTIRVTPRGDDWVKCTPGFITWV
ncbi:MAG: alpha-glucan family phosphorylase [Desulfobacterales bacterium]|nr:alpha-glucan family phosphorylase [Desulfobacterales bacterium]